MEAIELGEDKRRCDHGCWSLLDELTRISDVGASARTMRRRSKGSEIVIYRNVAVLDTAYKCCVQLKQAKCGSKSLIIDRDSRQDVEILLA
jgi:hypothetical protein